MTIIQQADLIDSVAAALQFISYYHPVDYIRHLSRAYEREQSPAAKDAIAQIPDQQPDVRRRVIGRSARTPGIVNVFLKIGMDGAVGPDSTRDGRSGQHRRRGQRGRASRLQLDPHNTLRASIVADPQFDRRNTGDNTPAVISMEVVPGDRVDVTIAAKGGGSENKSKLAMLNPSDSIVDWVLKTVPTMGAGWCPPGMLGIGIGGTAEKAVLLAKQSLMDDIDMHELLEKKRGAQSGGPALSKVGGVARRALREGQRARHRRAGTRRPDDGARRQDRAASDARGLEAGRDDPELCGDAPRAFRARRVGDRCISIRRRWPNGRTCRWAPDAKRSKRVDLDTLTRDEVASWQPG